MKSDKYSRNIENLGKALAQFSKALAEPESAIVRDASIQRFEFTYELLWKTVKSFLEDLHGVRAVTPRQVFKGAFAIDIIDNEASLKCWNPEIHWPTLIMKTRPRIFMKNVRST